MRSANQSISLLSEYDRLLEREPDELDRLHVQLLSGTTSFLEIWKPFEYVNITSFRRSLKTQ
ncbi:hypothetical protein OE903_10785 [Bacillus sp. B6(2022)]|nr:hypothetical protein [Bacillus sp. B6(2022)]